MIKNLGILGGSFNPVHLGHLGIATSVLGQGIDKVLFLPDNVSPFKVSGVKPLEDMSRHRLEMLKLCCVGNPLFGIETMEIHTDVVSYTYVTLQKLKEKYGEHISFILGLDSLLSLHLWYRSQELVRECDFITVLRPGVERPVGLPGFPKDIEDRLLSRIIEPKGRYDISSTIIREKIRKQESLRGLVPLAVEEYIKANHLYLDP